MNKKLRISFFLHTTIGEDNGSLYVKDLLSNYFNGFSEYIEVTLVGTFQKRQFFHSSVISQSIKVELINAGATRNKVEQFKNYISAISNSDACFLFMPCKSSVLAGVLCFIFRKPFITYFGANWHDLEMSNPNRRKLKAFIYHLASNFLSINSIFSLHTGAGILESYKGQNKFLTVPILNLSSSSFHIRTAYKDLTSADSVNILFVGNLSKNKGVEFLIRAVSTIDCHNLNFSIVGEGDQRVYLESLAKDLGIEDSIVFHGFVNNGPELFDFYIRSDIFILPSFSEGLPRVLYEAAGNGCAIITTPVNSIPYVFRSDYDCLFIQPGSIDDISSAIRRLCSQKGLNAQLAKNAYRTVLPILREKACDQHFKLMKEYL